MQVRMITTTPPLGHKTSLSKFDLFLFSILILEPVPLKLYLANLRVTNLARMNIVLKASDNIPVNGFNIKSNVIAEITKKTGNPQDLIFQAFDVKTNKILAVNGKQSFTVKPTEVKGPPVSLIIKAQGMS